MDAVRMRALPHLLAVLGWAVVCHAEDDELTMTFPACRDDESEGYAKIVAEDMDTAEKELAECAGRAGFPWQSIHVSEAHTIIKRQYYVGVCKSGASEIPGIGFCTAVGTFLFRGADTLLYGDRSDHEKREYIMTQVLPVLDPDGFESIYHVAALGDAIYNRSKDLDKDCVEELRGELVDNGGCWDGTYDGATKKLVGDCDPVERFKPQDEGGCWDGESYSPDFMNDELVGDVTIRGALGLTEQSQQACCRQLAGKLQELPGQLLTGDGIGSAIGLWKAHTFPGMSLLIAGIQGYFGALHSIRADETFCRGERAFLPETVHQEKTILARSTFILARSTYTNRVCAARMSAGRAGGSSFEESMNQLENDVSELVDGG